MIYVHKPTGRIIDLDTDLELAEELDDMPFESKAQMRYLFAKEPKIAKEFAAVTSNIKALPARKGTNKKRAKK